MLIYGPAGVYGRVYVSVPKFVKKWVPKNSTFLHVEGTCLKLIGCVDTVHLIHKTLLFRLNCVIWASYEQKLLFLPFN